MISRTAEYALRAMVALRNQPPDSRISNRDLSSATGIPQNYLSKIMHALGRADLVVSERGPGGGFRLPPNAGSITAYEIVRHFEDLDGQRRCLLGRAVCRDSSACPAHEGWKAVRDSYERFLKETDLTTLTLREPVSGSSPRARSKPRGRKRG